jgi:O-succinylbenzoic acid--CoA ligase
MARLLEYLKKCSDRHWLIGYDNREFVQLAEQFYLQIIDSQNSALQIVRQSSQHTSPKILLAEGTPIRFIAGFIAACSANCSVFLCNPAWGEREWQQVFALVQPDIIIQNSQFKIQNSKFKISDSGTGGFIRHICGQTNNLGEPAPTISHSPLPTPHSPLIMVPTSGSSGKIRFAIHTWDTLSASVQGFQTYFELQQINSFCVLPLYHVSGLMQFMRSLTTGGKLAILPFKTVESGIISDIDPAEFFISLVPTQLQRLLQIPNLVNWLAQFQTVLLGGAPAWQELLTAARNHRIRLAPTYGMTETASQIATLKPEDFLKGYNKCGRVLPHAQVKIVSPKNEILGTNKIGIVSIQAKSLALGYYPECDNKSEKIELDDLGFIDDRGYLNIVGRNSDKIITGGENVYPGEVEAAIRATQLVDDIAVIGICDRTWGEVVTAIYVPKSQLVSPAVIKAAIANSLCKFKIPKSWISAKKLPRNAQGKLNREQLQAIAILSQDNCDRGLKTVTENYQSMPNW